MTKVLETKQLTRAYGTKKAVNNMSITIEENGIIGLIGRNGAGKTTLLKMLAGYIRPSAGELTLWGHPVFDNLDVVSQLVFVDEEIQYNPGFRLEDIMAVSAHAYPNWDDAFARKLVRYFGLDPKKHYKKLSRGMKTQFNIIIGLASRAPLTLLDEPTLGLDAAVRKEFYGILLKDYMEHPRTIVISSHLLSEMENLLTELVLIDNGALVLHQPIDVLQEYGIYLEGSKDTLLDFATGKTVYRTETLGQSAMVAMRNDLNDSERADLQRANIEVRKIPVQDMCIYLTKGREEGGFDAFEISQ